ncbi:sigma-70 family RNA polymerase sigma factor [Glaciecola sp. XM2]|jgi:RNA polymerase sigma factor (TIGR02999 family)|uniref:ECF-type sigma factor n=1 Tax=Glaciecola sp. XM2 TaxID=1914931 RepID=UPI001BDE34E8|nr:ECF-type sigma factor [Glaciecola sp. XM2]MBT1451235.1 sigma-70 family RNA polymerase sigma factor [Glaciecola sp. XM2]
MKNVPQAGRLSGQSNEDNIIANGLFKDAYDALLTLARNQRRRVGLSATMMTQDILHNCFLKLSGKTIWESEEQFMRTASIAIRQVIVDHARKKLTIKRGSGKQNLTYQDNQTILPEYNETAEQILLINDLLEQLKQKQPRLAKVVDARYFAGLTEAETALALGVSDRTIRRDWRLAKAWLAEKLEASI